MNIRLKKVITYSLVMVIFNLISPNIKKAEISSTIYSSDYPYGEEPCFSTHTRLNSAHNYCFKADESADMNKFAFKYYREINEKTQEFFNFNNGDNYSNLKGVSCFRGNNERNGGSFGTVNVNEKKLKIIWQKNIGAIDSWTGVGWNGQPAIVMWDDETKNNMNIENEKKSKSNLTEVIYATLDGNVYFIDADDGSETRKPLSIGAPVKGSLTVDPRGYPLLYVGQGIDSNGSRRVDFAYRIFSLIDFKKLYEIKGNDIFSKRNWGAFDSTALIDRAHDNIVICGENGVVYKGKLNTEYKNGTISIKPEIDKYRYDSSLNSRIGIENSIAAFDKYGFFADNDGMLQCMNLDTLTPVWTQNVNDDTDSTVVIEKNSGLYLYTACEVDHQGNNGYCYMRKIDGECGKVLWENKYKCAYNEEVNGGALATPICGKGDIKDLVIFNIARTPNYSGGYLVAFDKETGVERWKIKLSDYCWSSPLALYTNEGKSYIVQCDSKGRAMLIEGINGSILDTIDLGSNIEGTPAAFNNMIVVGTRGGKIIGFKIF